VNLAGAAQGAGGGAVSGAALPQQPALPSVAPTNLASGDAANVTNATQGVTEPAKEAAPATQPSKENSASGLLGATGSASGSESSKVSHGLLDAPKTTTAEEPSKPARGLNVAGDANGSASASRSGVSAEGTGSMSAARK
jgi:hypothetical protein